MFFAGVCECECVSACGSGGVGVGGIGRIYRRRDMERC